MTLASPCYVPTEDISQNFKELSRLRRMPLDMKVAYSKTIIQKFFIENDGKIYVGFSGGKDSTVTLDLVRQLYPNTPAVYFDTGMEFPENRKFVKTFDNVVFMTPKLTYKQIIEQYGYPCIGKNCAHFIDLAQRGKKSGIDQMNADTKYGYKKYKWMVDAPFKVSERCCNIMKKEPAKRYHRETGRVPIIGTRTEESTIREHVFIEYGDIHTSHDIPICAPLSIWTEKDVLNYIELNKIRLSDLYNMGYERSGCMFCMFGIMTDRDRFLKLKATHPTIWANCMRERESGGLGMREVLDFMGIPTGCEQTNLKEFVKKGEGGIAHQ